MIARAWISAYATVVFGQRVVVGVLVLVATCVVPGRGVAGAVAVIAATVTARSLGYRVDAIRSGHYGYSALLVALAASLHHPCDARLLVLVALAGVLAALATAVLADALHRGAALPVLALPFVLLASVLAPALAALPATAPGALDRPLVELVFALPEPIDAVLRAFGAIVLRAHVARGRVVLAAVLAHSRIATALAVIGIACAYAMADVLGVAGAPVLAMAYNAALAAMAIGAVFFVPGRASLVAGALAALSAAWLAVGMAALLGPIAAVGVGLLAWPFVIVSAVMMRALQLRAPDRAPYPGPLPGATPEANLAFATALDTVWHPGAATAGGAVRRHVDGHARRARRAHPSGRMGARARLRGRRRSGRSIPRRRHEPRRLRVLRAAGARARVGHGRRALSDGAPDARPASPTPRGRGEMRW